jgi:hypothetical protein
MRVRASIAVPVKTSIVSQRVMKFNHAMNTETATQCCSYCQEPFLAERMVIRSGALILVLHAWCTRALSQDLKESFDSWYTAKYFTKPMASATK